MADASGVRSDDNANRNLARAAQVRAHQIEQFRRRVLPGFVDQEQREAAALILLVVRVRL